MRAEGMNEDAMREEIKTELSLNMFVEAGAGAGKTSLIVSRIVNMLSNGVEPGEIVVITFTRAAAEELRGRIIEEVAKKAKEDPELQEKLHRLNDMNISTIHSFCNVLLHEQGLVTKLPIDIELLVDDDEDKEKKELFDAYLKTLKKADWDKLETSGGNRKLRYLIRRDMENLFYQLADLPGDTDIMIPQHPVFSKQKNALDVIRYVMAGDPSKGIPSLENRLITALNSCVNPEKKKEGFKEAASYSEARDNYCRKGKNPFMQEISDVAAADHSLECENKVFKLLLNTKGKDYSLLSRSNYNDPIDKEKIPAANKKISDDIKAILTDDIRALFPEKIDFEDEDKNTLNIEEQIQLWDHCG